MTKVLTLFTLKNNGGATDPLNKISAKCVRESMKITNVFRNKQISIYAF
jgi:hypothetical protein